MRRFGVLAAFALALPVMPPSAARSEMPATLRQLTAPATTTLPSFTLPDPDGVPVKLHEQRAHVVLVHFFATWCEPCRDELASLSRLAQSPLGERVTFVAVNVAEVPVRVRRFLAATPVGFPVALDADRAVTRAWGVGVLPTTFVLDPTLRPRLYVEGDLDWSHPDVLSALDALIAGDGEGKPQAK